MKSLPLFIALTIFLSTTFLEKVVTAISIIVIELQFGPFPTLTLFASNLLFLWNISYLYMLMMMISNGWCISKVTLSPSEKQAVVLVGAGMMLVEVLLVGEVTYYSVVLLLGYFFVFRIFSLHLQNVILYLKLQLESITVIFDLIQGS